MTKTLHWIRFAFVLLILGVGTSVTIGLIIFFLFGIFMNLWQPNRLREGNHLPPSLESRILVLIVSMIAVAGCAVLIIKAWKQGSQHLKPWKSIDTEGPPGEDPAI